MNFMGTIIGVVVALLFLGIIFMDGYQLPEEISALYSGWIVSDHDQVFGMKIMEIARIVESDTTTFEDESFFASQLILNAWAVGDTIK